VDLLQLEPKGDLQDQQLDIVAKISHILEEYREIRAKYVAEKDRCETLLKEHEEVVMMLNKRPENAEDLIEFVEISLTQSE